MNLNRNILLAAESAADQTIDDADAVFGEVEAGGDLAAVAERNLAPAIDSDAARWIWNGQTGLRFDERVFDGLRAVFTLDHHIGLREAFGQVAVLQTVMLQAIAMSAG